LTLVLTDAKLAAHAAADLAQKTGSELHVACVGLLPRIDPYYDLISPSYRFKTERHADEEAQRFLDDQVKQIEAGGGTVAQAHVRMGRPDAEIIDLALKR
jgi:nucleotide-binding universal stress UspA family protein